MLQHLCQHRTKLLSRLVYCACVQHVNHDALKAPRSVDEVPSDTEDRCIQCRTPAVYRYAAGQCRGTLIRKKMADGSVDNVQMGLDGLLARLLQSSPES